MRRADGSPAAGSTVFVPGRRGATTVAAADGSFALSAVSARSGEVLTVAAKLTMGNDVFAGGVSVTPVLGGVTNAGTVTLQPLCDFGFEGRLRAGPNDVSGLAKVSRSSTQWSGRRSKSAVRFQYIAGQDVGYRPLAGNGYQLVQARLGPQWGEVKALAVFDERQRCSTPRVQLDHAGRTAVSNVARWNGAPWSPSASGIVQRSSLRAAGVRLTAVARRSTPEAASSPREAFTVNRIARWDGFTWSALGSGVLARGAGAGSLRRRSGPALFAAGTWDGPKVLFSRWNGTAWTALPSPRATSTRWRCTPVDGANARHLQRWRRRGLRRRRAGTAVRHPHRRAGVAAAVAAVV